MAEQWFVESVSNLATVEKYLSFVKMFCTVLCLF